MIPSLVVGRITDEMCKHHRKYSKSITNPVFPHSQYTSYIVLIPVSQSDTGECFSIACAGPSKIIRKKDPAHEKPAFKRSRNTHKLLLLTNRTKPKPRCPKKPSPSLMLT